LFRSAEDVAGVAAVEDDFGHLAFLRGRYAHALERHGSALALRRRLGDQRSLALSLHHLGMVHQASGNHAEALQHFSDALAARRTVGDLLGVVQSLESLAAAWRDRGDAPRSLDCLAEALQLAQEIGDRLAQAAILARMGETFAGVGRVEDAAQRLAQAVEIAQASGDRLLQSETARLLAEVHLRLGDFASARVEAERALALAGDVDSPPYIGVAHRVLGAVLAKAGKSDEDKALAELHLTKSIEILCDVGNELELGRSYQSYADILSARGDADGAATFNERATEISERLAPTASAAARSSSLE
jgi:tetratricopeptide (TPR) repeat protein